MRAKCDNILHFTRMHICSYIITHSAHTFYPAAMLKGDYEPAMQISLFQKDLRLAVALGDSLNQPLPLAVTANKVRYKPPPNGSHALLVQLVWGGTPHASGPPTHSYWQLLCL